MLAVSHLSQQTLETLNMAYVESKILLNKRGKKLQVMTDGSDLVESSLFAMKQAS